jgi:ParB family transcriptional regulator, chromosome partitioning protein
MTSTTKKTSGIVAPLAGTKRRKSGPEAVITGARLAATKFPAGAPRFGGPLDLDMDLIDEDPRQPRTEDNPGFSDESLAELAASIALRNVKTPISVRDNPDAPGRFIINHGARRFRGSRRAGKTTIPGFIDNDYNEADQVVENLQRNELTAREIADYIGRELAKGIRKGEIAKAISKSPAFVTQHVTLLDLPDPIAGAFNAGRVRDVTVVNELVTAFKKKPKEVSGWLGDESQEITRGAVKLLREFLENKLQHERANQDSDDGEGASGDDQGDYDTEPKPENQVDPDKLRKAIVQVRHNRRPARLILNRRPPADGFAWLRYEDDGQEVEVNLAQVRLVALVEG